MASERFVDGTPVYHECVQKSYRKLQVRTSGLSGLAHQNGAGIRLGIYQAEADLWRRGDETKLDPVRSDCW